jgi:hypothetical protein
LAHRSRPIFCQAFILFPIKGRLMFLGGAVIDAVCTVAACTR